MGEAAGFDFNHWQALNQPSAAVGVPVDAETPETVTQGGIDQLVQNAFRVLGVNPDLKGHGVLPAETNVAGGLALQNAAPVRDTAGGVLAGVLRYFTRALHQLISTSDDAGAATAQVSETVLDSADPAPPVAALAPEVRAQVLEAGRLLMAFDPVDSSAGSLGELRAPAAPEMIRGAAERERAA